MSAWHTAAIAQNVAEWRHLQCLWS